MIHLGIIKKRKKLKKKVIINKSCSMAAIFVPKYGMKPFKRSKIHPVNTLETF